MESVSELESLSSTLEELGKRMSTCVPSTLERMTPLLSHRVIRVVPVVEPLS